MPKALFECTLEKAQESEKIYNWQGAAEHYEKAISIETKAENLFRASQLCDRLGFCYFRASFQAQSYPEFIDRVKLSADAYDKESRLLEATHRENEAQFKHAQAWAAYARSYLETTPPKRKELLSEWWTLENQALEEHERAGDLLAVGQTISSMLEHSNYNRFWLASDISERIAVLEEGFVLAEKAIQALSELNNPYELARAYFSASWFYSWGDWHWESEKMILEQNQKCQSYANKAVELSQKTDDAWLISWAQLVAWNAAFLYPKNPALALVFAEKTLQYGRIAGDNFLMGFGNMFVCLANFALAQMQEDPDEQKDFYEKAAKSAQEGITNFENINHQVGFVQISFRFTGCLVNLARIETDSEKKQSVVEKITAVTQELNTRLNEGGILSSNLAFALSHNLSFLSEIKTDLEEKRKLLQEALFYVKKYREISERVNPFSFGMATASLYELFLVQNALSEIAIEKKDKLNLLLQAVASIEESIDRIERKRNLYIQSGYVTGFTLGQYYEMLGRALHRLYSLTEEEAKLPQALEAFRKAIMGYQRADMSTHVAESYWHIAQLFDLIGKREEASQTYENAAEAYGQASAKIPQLGKFYTDYSSYMQSWSQIEQARYTHSIETYDKAKEHYERAALLHAKTESWGYLAPNYFAWAKMEEAESLSRKENTQQAKLTFQKALEQFVKAEESIEQKIQEIQSPDEREMAQRLLMASDLRRKFCQARIQLEEGKLLDREGKYMQSSKSYGEAAQSIESIIAKVESKFERKELELIAILCSAWAKMAIAEETTSSEAYLEAASLFEQAKDLSDTKKNSLWALGNSNFCKGLAAGVKYQSDLDIADHARAKGYIKNAATNYLQAGFESASEYARATQRLFDAYLVMNQAEAEIDQELRAKKYQMAENLLQIAAGSFVKAKQPEKTTQVRKILESVREERCLAVSLNEVLQAPSIASTTLSFSAPSPTSEASVGLEQFQHANVQANLVAGMREVRVGESFCLTVECVNAGKEPALLIRVEDFVPPDFVVVEKPAIYRLEESCLNMKGKQIAPLKLVEAKLVLQPTKKGVYQLKPTLHYLDELGQNKTLQLKSVEINVEEVILSNRVSTGTRELDSLMLGGIPEGYAVVLTGAPSDERSMLIKNFLEAGARKHQVTFHITTEADGLEGFLEKPGFYLFVCNPNPRSSVPDLPNVSKLRSKTDLTNLNIALAKVYRSLGQSFDGPKRVCLEIVSDVLLDYGAKTTRKWLAELITDLGSKGYTMLAEVNADMHPPDQATAVLELFDGEISLYQTEDPLECKKSIRIKKLRNQDYIKNPICLRKE